ncbi:aldehyde dehydrogenase family protein [Rhodococcus sp. 06-156-3C]|uniref:aldehyde dehydrogenase family protein n=1 Tax=Nocardiaceae TaxID=85025 RepID=UPI00052304D0|nr:MULTISPECIES: aldehyde dehydrogenase family protein [Rhodococcus]OZD11635.1 aldehyde dehydrogenase family protein [Rhodococcus sp. 06-156-4C]OZD15477.1 aldehyde dehydrogenase family protein [Rhodococcus sp. 06-156-4a]OZD23643.1 aldehyde dehydrogenase family protein [Rhodococcus sp. 06-156-3C]OZD27285.1 aldehyde dehydrogenase family protein [Rhodococcus sp. 06-156-3b]OZD31319.1 aldehyde dehydrogenase family protein [Rhodococcus sp. 06-156-3]
MDHDFDKMYIDGEWVAPSSPGSRPLINPATEEPWATVATGGGVEDVDRAVAAAKRAFGEFSRTSVQDRIDLIDRIIAAYERRGADLSALIADEVGIPISFKGQVTSSPGHMRVARDVIRDYAFERQLDGTILRREPIGVCGLISPWNWPIQTSVIKVIYGIAAGCTMVLKPSDASPASGVALAEIMHEAGTPSGVFNLVIGRGSVVGDRLSRHPDVDLISFTGSTSAGRQVGEAAAQTVKRTCLELGGKSANIVLTDGDLKKAAQFNIARGFSNSGQSCHAPSRLLVHESQVDEILSHLVDAIDSMTVGDPHDPNTTHGPLVHAQQFNSVQRHIEIGLQEGGQLITGGPGRVDGFDRGFYCKPTVLAGVTPDMTLASEEIFGPVLVVMPYRTENQALEIANDSIFGLGGYVFSEDRKRGYEFASGIRAGRICFNGSNANQTTPMGGYKESGVGRSMGVYGLEEYLEIKSIYGFEGEASTLPF